MEKTQQEHIAKQTGVALGGLVVDGILQAVLGKASQELTRFQKLQGEAETQTAALREEATKCQNIVIDAQAKNQELSQRRSELQLAVEKLEKERAELQPLVDKLKAEGKRAAANTLNILHGENRG